VTLAVGVRAGREPLHGNGTVEQYTPGCTACPAAAAVLQVSVQAALEDGSAPVSCASGSAVVEGVCSGLLACFFRLALDCLQLSVSCAVVVVDPTLLETVPTTMVNAATVMARTWGLHRHRHPQGAVQVDALLWQRMLLYRDHAYAGSSQLHVPV
jgi:hypothetical protein